MQCWQFSPLCNHVSCSTVGKTSHEANKAFIDIKLHPGVKIRHTVHYGQTWRHSQKPEVFNLSQHRHSRTKPQGICTNIAEDRFNGRDNARGQTHRQTNRNSPFPYRGGVKIFCHISAHLSLRIKEKVQSAKVHQRTHIETCNLSVQNSYHSNSARLAALNIQNDV